MGNGELHIAHLLYGGLLMLLAIFLLLVLLNTGARWYAALLGGIGFGFFIDEIGKFISKDVNYFFKPAVAVMYAVFMVLFLALGALRRWRVATRPRDALANALTLLAGAAGQPLDVTTRTTVSSLLDSADPDDPVVRGLRERPRPGDRRRPLPGAGLRPGQGPAGGALPPLHPQAALADDHRVGRRDLPALPPAGHDRGAGERRGARRQGGERQHRARIQFTAALVSAAFIIIGLIMMRRSRLQAYKWFLRAVLISLLITQLFVFYHDQFAALSGPRDRPALLPRAAVHDPPRGGSDLHAGVRGPRAPERGHTRRAADRGRLTTGEGSP